jgi:hypothetical protein
MYHFSESGQRYHTIHRLTLYRPPPTEFAPHLSGTQHSTTMWVHDMQAAVYGLIFDLAILAHYLMHFAPISNTNLWNCTFQDDVGCLRRRSRRRWDQGPWRRLDVLFLTIVGPGIFCFQWINDIAIRLILTRWACRKSKLSLFRLWGLLPLFVGVRPVRGLLSCSRSVRWNNLKQAPKTFKHLVNYTAFRASISEVMRVVTLMVSYRWTNEEIDLRLGELSISWPWVWWAASMMIAIAIMIRLSWHHQLICSVTHSWSTISYIHFK